MAATARAVAVAVTRSLWVCDRFAQRFVPVVAFDSASAAPYHARPMAHVLRDRRTPDELAAARQTIDYEGNISDFGRLKQIVEDDLARLSAAERPAAWSAAPVTVKLAFRYVDAKRSVPAVEGSVSAVLDAVCQRCLEAFRVPLVAELRHVLTTRGESYGNYGVWELAEDVLTPADLVEETLIMALPLSAAHESRADCGPLAEQTVGDAPERGDKTRPFAELRRLIETDKAPDGS